MTDFLQWWADHWPLIPILIAYFIWTLPAHLVAWAIANPFKRRREP